jgi:AcrR family transcriptional regulator
MDEQGVRIAVTIKPHDRILNAATKLFYEEGTRSVGVDRIIAEANVAPMTLYRHFGGKDELVAAALEHWSTEWLQRLRDAVDRRGDDPEARFAGLWSAVDNWLAAEGPRGSFIANTAAEYRSQPDHPAHRVIAEHQMATRQLLEDLAKTAGAHDSVGLARQLQLLLDGAITTAMIDRRSDVAADIATLAKIGLADALA